MFVPRKKERRCLSKAMSEDSLSKRFNLFQLEEEDEEEKAARMGKCFPRILRIRLNARCD